MFAFDIEKSQRLDEEIVRTLSSLLESQKLIREQEEKERFLLRERKIIYDLFMRVNEERRVNFFANE
jgi:hypothetical protein